MGAIDDAGTRRSSITLNSTTEERAVVERAHNTNNSGRSQAHGEYSGNPTHHMSIFAHVLFVLDTTSRPPVC